MLVKDHIEKAGDKEKQMVGKEGEKFPFHEKGAVFEESILLIRIFGKGFGKEEAGGDEKEFYGDISLGEQIIVIKSLPEMENNYHDGKQEL